MSIPTQLSLSGFIASDPQLSFTSTGRAKVYVKVGCEHFRRETDGSFTDLEPTFHDLVVYNKTAERAYDRFNKGDRFVASGYIHEYEVETDDTTVIREQFVARKIGHDLARTPYSVSRRSPAPANRTTPAPVADQPPAVGM